MLAGSSLLHEKNPNLHASIEVEGVVAYLRANGEPVTSQPVDKLTAYLGFLASEYVQDGILTGNTESAQRQIEAACIQPTPKNAELYATFRERIARELGWGAVFDANIPDEAQKLEALRTIHQDQKTQLFAWVEELNSDHNAYPDWFKYWTFENVKRLTAFNEDLGKNGQSRGFEKRSASSFALFPELDRTSLALVHNALIEKLGGKNMDVGGENLRPLLAKTQFSELYAEAQNIGFAITDELKAHRTGTWHTFGQSTAAEDAEKLANFVKTYRTGWCTAGSSTAATQLRNGDFYIWASTNPENGADEVPRIAVRMEDGYVAEVRGINPRQELEPELFDTAMEKVTTLLGGESYFIKATHMAELTELHKKLTADPTTELSDAELHFLYEVADDIQGFGYGRDPRIKALKTMRAGQDNERMVSITREAVRSQLEGALMAYAKVVTYLDYSSSDIEPAYDKAQLRILFDHKDQEWQQNGAYDYLAKRLLNEGVRYTLVITPYGQITGDRLKSLVDDFSRENWGQTIRPLDDTLYNNLYSSSDIVGANQSLRARLSLIPSDYDQRFNDMHITEQIQLLRTLELEAPHLRLHCPSVLEAITYWHALRAQDPMPFVPFSGNATADAKTTIAHIDMTPYSVKEGFTAVPWTVVREAGVPSINRWLLRNASAPVRLSIG